MKRAILVGLCLLAMTFVSPIMAQWNNTPQNQSTGADLIIPLRSVAPMIPSGSKYASKPMLAMDGSATYAGAPVSAPRRIGPTPSGDIDIRDKVPVGDAILPMLLMAMAYAAYIYRRKKSNRNAIINLTK